MTGAAPKKVYSALNGIRGIAALAVVIFHAWPLFGVQLAPGGYLAVDLFFVLSGFVIAHAYGNKLGNGLSVWQFFKIRLIRFYPLYFLGLLFGIVLAILLLVTGSASALPPSMFVLAIVCGLLFIPFPFMGGGDIFPLNIPSWSLFYELLVNVLYASVYQWLSKKSIIAILIVSFVILSLGILKTGGANLGPSLLDAHWTFARTVFSFSAGLLIYDYKRAVNMSPLLVMAVAVVVFLLPVSPTYRPIFDLLIIAIVFPIMVFVLAGTNSNKFEKTFEFLGAISFGVYALHYPIIWLVNGFSNKLGVSTVYAGVIMLPLLVVGCVFVDKYFDRPIRQFIKNKSLSKK